MSWSQVNYVVLVVFTCFCNFFTLQWIFECRGRYLYQSLDSFEASAMILPLHTIWTRLNLMQGCNECIE